jgi:hypothetical protein
MTRDAKKPSSRPALPAKLRRTLEERRAAPARQVDRMSPRTVAHRQGPSRQRRG